ncbi:MAG TPA: S41 family peptidase [Desulfuromonadales bacterium]|nr:S41 family peptidase [Desulfuromonadales bacterium]
MHKGKRATTFIVLLVLIMVGWMSLGEINRSSAAQVNGTSEYKELQLFTDVLSIIKKSYVEPVNMKKLLYGAINGMLSSLDPHSSFMPPEVFKEMKIDTSGEFGGLGIEITIRDGVLTIVAPIEGTPASKAGLKAGDQIFKIENRLTKNMNIMDAVKMMRGPAGSKIAITVMRNSFAKPKEFTLTREIIKIKSVKFKTLEDGYGYVRIVQFQERTAVELHHALDTLRAQNGGHLKGLVLDLRNNPGGLLEQAVKVCDTFLDHGLIVYTDGREEGSKMRFSAHQAGTEPGYPMVVLINGGSASASEIVSGALQDQERAVIMGTQSFGKGSVQTIIPLGDGSGLRLTTARYYTPNGTSIQAKGITPNIVVPQVEVVKVENGNQLKESDLKNHFSTPAPEKIKGTVTTPSSQSPQKFKLDKATRHDYQLMRALDLLKGWQVFKELKLPKAA